jgi:hypothetical protein
MIMESGPCVMIRNEDTDSHFDVSRGLYVFQSLGIWDRNILG